jgi:hypothetical protein
MGRLGDDEPLFPPAPVADEAAQEAELATVADEDNLGGAAEPDAAPATEGDENNG